MEEGERLRASLRELRALLLDAPDAALGATLETAEIQRMRLQAWLGGPVYLGFAALDAVMYPERFVEFLAMRSLLGVACIAVLSLGRDRSRLRAIRLFVHLSSLGAIGVLSLMCALTEGFASPYVTGHLLVMTAVVAFDSQRPREMATFLLFAVASFAGLNFALHPDASTEDVTAGMFFTAGGALISFGTGLMIQLQRARLYKATAELAQRNDDLRRASEHQGEFLRTVSHELRTPLATIAGYAELLAADQGVSDASKKHIERIDRSTEGLLRIINDILDLSKIEAGRLELVIEPFDPRELVEEIAEETRVMLGRKSDAVEVRVCVAPIESMRSDRVRVRQVLLNLAHNATKFTREGHIELALEHDARGLAFVVADTGLGIAPDDRDAIFRAFTQTRAGVDAGGTGLGLSIVRRLLQLLEGEVELESEVGVGTKFRVRLPLDRGAQT
ncbi:MAG: sensor histidine kinase [Sandaracinaceae bacterium]